MPFPMVARSTPPPPPPPPPEAAAAAAGSVAVLLGADTCMLSSLMLFRSMP